MRDMGGRSVWRRGWGWGGSGKGSLSIGLRGCSLGFFFRGECSFPKDVVPSSLFLILSSLILLLVWEDVWVELSIL